MDVNELAPDFQEFLRLLTSEQVEYLLVGGYAVIYHGFVRATNDMDIWINTNPENVAKLSKVLVEFGFSPESVPPEMFLRPNKIFQIGVPPVRIDVLTKISGLDFTEAYPHRTTIAHRDYSINIIGLEDLRTNKQASGRPKDLADLDNLK